MPAYTRRVNPEPVRPEFGSGSTNVTSGAAGEGSPPSAFQRKREDGVRMDSWNDHVCDGGAIGGMKTKLGHYPPSGFGHTS